MEYLSVYRTVKSSLCNSCVHNHFADNLYRVKHVQSILLEVESDRKMGWGGGWVLARGEVLEVQGFCNVLVGKVSCKG